MCLRIPENLSDPLFIPITDPGDPKTNVEYYSIFYEVINEEIHLMKKLTPMNLIDIKQVFCNKMYFPPFLIMFDV